MTKTLALAAGAGILALATLEAQSFNVRPGTWEVTMTMGGTMAMQGVPPEMRAAIEEQLKRPQTSQSCVTAEDIRNFDIGKMGDDDANCKVTSSKITATAADVTRVCTGDESYTDTAHFEAPNPQTLRANISRKGSDGEMTMALTGRWVNADCKD